MTKNAVSVFGNFAKEKLPAHIAQAMEETESNIAPKVTVPTLSYEGKVWTVVLNGEKKRLTKVNEDGEKEPLSIFKGVILDYAKRRGRAYYEGSYDPSKVSAPKCWSEDGVTPHSSVSDEDRQHHKCEGCPMSAKGSRITDQNKMSVACSQHRMLVVIPAGKYDFEPLRMKLAITSDWDANSPEHEQEGWYAFSQYLDQFRNQKVGHTGLCVTKFKFDQSVAFPKVLFSPDRWLSEEELTVVRPLWDDERVKTLLGGAWTPAGKDGVKTLPAPAAASPAAPTAAQKVAQKAVKAAPAEEDGEEEAPAPKKAPKAAAKPAKEAEDADWTEEEAPAPKKAAKAAPKPAKAAEDEEEWTDDEPAPKKAAKPAKAAKADDEGPEMLKPKKAAPAKDEELEDMLSEWADE